MHFQTARFGKNAHIAQRLLKTRLIRRFYQVVWCLVQNASANREIRLQVVDIVEQLLGQARNAHGISHDFQTVLARTAQIQRAINAYQRCKRGALTMRAHGPHVRKLVFNIRSKRHYFCAFPNVFLARRRCWEACACCVARPNACGTAQLAD